MSIFLIGETSKKYQDIVKSKFFFLYNFFEFNPGKIEIKIVNSNEFNQEYKEEFFSEPEPYVVGFAVKNGRIIILNKEDFPLRNHDKDEFDKVIVHELCHIFIRRILDPKNTYIWIEEGICQYLSFGDREVKLANFVDFSLIETIDGWIKNPVYMQSAYFFKYLIEKFGKKRLVNFIKNIKDKGEIESFKEEFGDIKKIQEDFFNYYKK